MISKITYATPFLYRVRVIRRMVMWVKSVTYFSGKFGCKLVLSPYTYIGCVITAEPVKFGWNSHGSYKITSFDIWPLPYIYHILLVVHITTDLNSAKQCVTPKKRSTCTPSVYVENQFDLSRGIIWRVNKHVAKRASMFNVSLLFYFTYCWKSENVICCGNECW